MPNIHGAVVGNQSQQLACLEVCCGYQAPQASIPYFVNLHILELHAHSGINITGLLTPSRWGVLWHAGLRMRVVMKLPDTADYP